MDKTIIKFPSRINKTDKSHKQPYPRKLSWPENLIMEIGVGLVFNDGRTIVRVERVEKRTVSFGTIKPSKRSKNKTEVLI